MKVDFFNNYVCDFLKMKYPHKDDVWLHEINSKVLIKNWVKKPQVLKKPQIPKQQQALYAT